MLRLPSSVSSIAVALCALVLSGCSTVWNEQQRVKLAQVAVTPATAAPNAYQPPSAKDSPNMAQGIPAATGGGLIPALLGAAIDKGVTANQQRKFEKTAATHFEALKQAMGDAPTAELDEALAAALKADEFFGPRLVEKGSATFTVKLLDYGLTKSPLTQGDDILLRVHLAAEVTLASGGDTLYSGRLDGVGRAGARAAEILTNPSFIPIGRKEAAADLVSRLQDELDIRLGRKKRGQVMRR